MSNMVPNQYFLVVCKRDLVSANFINGLGLDRDFFKSIDGSVMYRKCFYEKPQIDYSFSEYYRYPCIVIFKSKEINYNSFIHILYDINYFDLFNNHCVFLLEKGSNNKVVAFSRYPSRFAAEEHYFDEKQFIQLNLDMPDYLAYFKNKANKNYLEDLLEEKSRCDIIFQ